MKCRVCGGTLFRSVEATRGTRFHYWDSHEKVQFVEDEEDETMETDGGPYCTTCNTAVGADDFEELIEMDWRYE